MMNDSINSRTCFREPIPKVLDVAKLLNDAVSAHIAGDNKGAEERFKNANNPVVWEWANSIMGKKSPYIQFRETIDSPPRLSVENRKETRMPNKKIQQEIHKRDGYNCRFCGNPVIRMETRKKIYSAYPKAVPWGKTNESRHYAFLTMWAQYDHIIPHSRGGDNSIDNIILTCAACNFGRMSYTLEEVGLIDPRLRLPIKNDWDGLERFNTKKSHH